MMHPYIYFKFNPGRGRVGDGGGGGALFVFLNNSETVKVVPSLLCNI